MVITCCFEVEPPITKTIYIFSSWIWFWEQKQPTRVVFKTWRAGWRIHLLVPTCQIQRQNWRVNSMTWSCVKKMGKAYSVRTPSLGNFGKHLQFCLFAKGRATIFRLLETNFIRNHVAQQVNRFCIQVSICFYGIISVERFCWTTVAFSPITNMLHQQLWWNPWTLHILAFLIDFNYAVFSALVMVAINQNNPGCGVMFEKHMCCWTCLAQCVIILHLTGPVTTAYKVPVAETWGWVAKRMSDHFVRNWQKFIQCQNAKIERGVAPRTQIG